MILILPKMPISASPSVNLNWGRIGQAVQRFKLIVYKYPKTDAEFEALLWLAQYYLKNADADSAIEYYKSIIDEFPDSPQMDQIHYELGQAYEIQGHSDDALEQYQVDFSP